MKVPILGRIFTFSWVDEVDSRGSLGETRFDEREIDVKRGQSQRSELDTLVHEVLHAACWAASEKRVASTAKAVADLLWRLGWRKKAGK